MRTGYDLVWLAAERTPNQLALVDDVSSRALTYRELIDEIDVIAAGLVARGVRAGARVATALPNTIEHCLALLALQRIAAVPAPLNFRLPAAQLASAVAEAQMFGAIIRNDRDAAEAVRQALPADGLLLSVGGDADSAVQFSACRGDPALLPPRPAPGPRDTAFIFYTAGTTGTPKAALIPHCASEPRVNWISPVAGMRPATDLRTLGLAPISHAMGYIVFHSTLAFSGTFYAMSAFDPVQALALIERHKITFLFTVPTIFQALVSAPKYRPSLLASVKRAISGGSAISDKLLERMAAEWQAEIGHGYGTTEVVCPLFQRNPVGQPRTFLPTYGSRVRVVRPGIDPEAFAPVGEPGELIVEAREDHIFAGYLNPAHTAEKIHDGWYFTGDACITNVDGSFDVIGRLDDVIRSGAESIYPEEIETVLAKHPDIREVCTIGIPDEYWGERVVACVVCADPQRKWSDFDTYCTEMGLAGFKRPKGYVFMPALPRNAMNKIPRRLLRQMVIDRNAAGGDGVYLVAA
jgi:2-furoate---CoA ligase